VLRSLEPDAVLYYHLKPVLYGTAASIVAGTGTRCALMTGIGALSRMRDYSDRWQTLYLRYPYFAAIAALMRANDVVVCQNPDDLRFLYDSSCISPTARAEVVAGSGVNLERYHYVENTPGKGISFLMITRLLGSKGVNEFIEAALEVGRRNPDTSFHLVGRVETGRDAILVDDLLRKVDGSTIHYHAPIDDVRPIIAECNVFVLPSYYGEGIPRTILEAMSMGRPIITADSPGCRETVVPGENGYLVPPRDVGALVQAMERFALQRDLIPTMGRRSRRMAERRFDVRTVDERMFRVIASTACARSGARTRGARARRAVSRALTAR